MDQISVIPRCIFCSLCELLAFHIPLIAFQMGITSFPLGIMFHYLTFLPPFLPPVHAHTVSCLQAFVTCFLMQGDQHAGITPGCEGLQREQLRCHSQCLQGSSSSTHSFFQAALLLHLWKQRCVCSCMTLAMVVVQHVQLSPGMCS